MSLVRGLTVALVGLLLLPTVAVVHNASPAAALVTLGDSFWATNLDNLNVPTGGLGLVVRNPSPSASLTADVYKFSASTGGPVLVDSATVAAAGSHVFQLAGPSISTSGVGTSGVFRLVTSAPAYALQMNPYSMIQSNDAATLLPEDALGLEHRILTYHPNAKESFFTVVATEAATKVTIIPSSATLGGSGVPALGAGVPVQFTLNAYQRLNVKSIVGGDLTGSQVVADKPVAVFAGAVCTMIGGVGACDTITEQMWPNDAWGTEYINCRAPQRSTEPVTLRVLALGPAPATVTTIPPTSTFSLPAGAWQDLVTNDNIVLRSTTPVAVAEYLHGDSSAANLGDPAFTQVLPTNQYGHESLFVVPPNFAQDHLTVAMLGPGGATSSGGPLQGWTPIPGTLAQCATISLADGAATLRSGAIAAGYELYAKLYGYDTYGSYAVSLPMRHNAPLSPADPATTWGAGDRWQGKVIVSGNDPGCGLGGTGSATAALANRAALYPPDPLGAAFDPAMPLMGDDRFLHGAAVIADGTDERFFVVGGAETCSFVPRGDVESLLLATGANGFEAEDSLSFVRIDPATADDGDTLFVVGGDAQGGAPGLTSSWHRPTAALESRTSSSTWTTGPDAPAGLTGADALWDPVQEVFVVAGGAGHPQAPSRLIQVYDPQTQQWVGPHLPAAVTGHAVGYCGDTAYVVGGTAARNYVYEYAVAQETAAVLPAFGGIPGASLPEGLAFHAAAGDGSQVWVSGGQDDASDDPRDTLLVWGCNPTSGWTVVNDMELPNPLAEHSMLYDDATLFVFGGTTTSGVTSWTGLVEGDCPSDAAYALDVSYTGWTALADLPEATASMGSAVLPDGRIVLVGGRIAGTNASGNTICHKPTASVWLYDPVFDSYAAGPDLPEALVSPAVFADGNVVYVMGGDETGDVPVPPTVLDDRQRRPSDDVYRWIVPPADALDEAGPWVSVAEMPLGVVHGEVVRSGGQVCVAGGSHHPQAAVRLSQCLDLGKLSSTVAPARLEEWLMPTLPQPLVHHVFEYDESKGAWIVAGGSTNGPLYHSKPDHTEMSPRAWSRSVTLDAWVPGVMPPRTFAVGVGPEFEAFTGTVPDQHRTSDSSRPLLLP